jgi:hypothetical protein
MNLGEIEVDVVQKDIKNIHLSVYPPNGKVRLAAPSRISLDTIRAFAISKMDWIRKQQKKFREQQRETQRECLERESHYLWGKRYLMRVVEADRPYGVELEQKELILKVRPGTDEEKRRFILDEWYRQQIKSAVPPLVDKWSRHMGVTINNIFVRRMKTRWGSCNPRSHNIRLNTELAKKPKECLEYLIVHELAHLLEPSHNARFISLMDNFMPKWKYIRGMLNCLPVAHEDWSE